MNVFKIIAVVIALPIGVALSYGVLRLVGEQHKQSCIEEVQARYPVGAVKNPDPFVPRQKGVISVKDLGAALDDCEATIF